MAESEKLALVEAIDSRVESLTEAHLSRRSDWYFHDIVPWERGESFREKPWDVSQCTISEDARTSLVLNLLTEDNLPYYHALIEKHMPNTSAFVKWNRLWTAEEASMRSLFAAICSLRETQILANWRTTASQR